MSRGGEEGRSRGLEEEGKGRGEGEKRRGGLRRGGGGDEPGED